MHRAGQTATPLFRLENFMEAPSPFLLPELIAARLSGSDGHRIGTAALIAPTIAITVSNLVENHQEYSLEVFVTESGSGLLLDSASVIARDDEIGFAALEFEPTLTATSLPATLLSTEQPRRGSSWTTRYYSYEVFGERSGTIEGTEQVGVQKSSDVFFRNLLKLSQSSSDEYSGAEGAPVIVNDQLVGLMTDRQWKGSSYAIPLTEMMKSSAWKLVDQAMQSSAAAATRDDGPTQQFRVTGAGLNLRQGPGTNDRVITVLFANSVVEKREESADKKWFRVRTEKDGAALEGWVAARFLKPVAGPVTTPSGPGPARFDSVAFLKRLSGSSLTALAHANGMRLVPQLPKMHMEHLIAGLFQKDGGPTRREFQRVGIDQDQLAELVVTEVGTVLPLASGYTPIFMTDELPPLSEHVEQALIAAAALAEANGSQSIRSRHLIRGALSVDDCTVIKAILRHGVEPGRIQLDDEPRPQPAPRRPTQAGIKSDDPEGEDLLDIKCEVEALCTVLASKDVKPPISLGLFGDWGSGKSFFMKKMEERFKKLAETARKEDSAYCANIVQLWFNAWHYMDTNLWASLATEIFDELAQELARQDAVAAGKDPDYERAQLLALRANANDELARAAQEKNDADAKVRASQQQLANIQSGETAVAMDPQAVLREGYRFAVQQPEVRETIRDAEATLNKGVDKAAEALNIGPADPGRDQLLELKGIWGYLRAITLAVRNARNKRQLILLVVAMLALTMGLALLPRAFFPQAWLKSAWVWITGVGVTVLAALSRFVPVARNAVKTIHGAIKASQESVEKARMKAEKELQSRHEELRQDAADAQQKLDDATTKAKELTQQLDDLRSDRKMSNFIRQRQQSSDYTRYLGVIAKARNDFEQLSTLLAKEQERSAREQKEQRQRQRSAAATNGVDPQAQTGAAGGLLPPIDRIILYIDDLDRCPESKVVDVLQAVHLLLAFPLFVVVVGVDPRWLLHSLRQHSKAFQNETEDDDSSAAERTHWRSTPLNYLEKIFQIPFTLNPMGKSGFGKMIDTLTESPKAEKSDAEPGKPATTQGETPEDAAAKPEAAVAEAVGPPAATDTVSAQPPPAAPAERSWSARLLHSLKRIFQRSSPSRTGKDADAPPAGDQIAGEPQAAPAAGNQPDKPPGQDAATQKLSAAEKTETTASQVVGQPAEVIEPHPDHLVINAWEQQFMKELHELVPSPRATKRFINIYRLIRASVDLDEEMELDEFTNEEHGKYRPVLLLLGILTGYPDQATEILRELLERPHPETWREFVDSFNGRAARRSITQNGKAAAQHGGRQLEGSANAEKSIDSAAAPARTSQTKADEEGENAATLDGKVAGALSEADAESWEQLLGKLNNLHQRFEPFQSCADFVEWAPKVARYSFQSGRVLLTRNVRGSEQKTGAA